MNLEDCIQALKEAGYILFKPNQGKPEALPNKPLYDCPYIPVPTLVDHRRSTVIERCAHEIQRRKIKPCNSKLNWRTLEQAYRATSSFDGEVWEAGVFQGVTALLLANCIREYGPADTRLRLFDTFSGMPDTDPFHDIHQKGDFADTSIEQVRDLVGDDIDVLFHEGFVPQTFEGLEACKLRLVHVDLDLYRPILDTLEFCYPRMERGIFVFDDYGTPDCPGALAAVDKFFSGRPEAIFCFSTGQAFAVKF